jgi:hypothetical protein
MPWRSTRGSTSWAFPRQRTVKMEGLGLFLVVMGFTLVFLTYTGSTGQVLQVLFS